MLEFLLDPASIALLGTIGGGIGIKIVETIISNKSEYEEIEISVPEPVKIDIPEAEKCIYFGHRQLEWSTAQNGDFDMADGLTCMEPHCPNCETIKKMYSVRQTNEARVADGLKPLPMPEYKHTYPVERPVRRDRPSLVESIRPNPKNGYKTVKKKDGQVVFVKGDSNKDKRPSPDAPDFQQFQWLKRYDPRYKGYTFKDYEFQQNLRRANSASKEKYELRSGEGNVIVQWEGIYDPNTNEYLGDFRVVNDEIETRNPVTDKAKADEFLRKMNKIEADVVKMLEKM